MMACSPTPTDTWMSTRSPHPKIRGRVQSIGSTRMYQTRTARSLMGTKSAIILFFHELADGCHPFVEYQTIVCRHRLRSFRLPS